MPTSLPKTRLLCALLLVAPLVLQGCDQLGIESATVIAARKEAEGRAIGAGCRHAARSVEQCYANNRRAEKAAIFAGWKDMNDYMRENKIEAVPAPPETALAAAETPAADTAEAAKPEAEAAAQKPPPKAPPKVPRR
jgi:hypothetical protein